MSLFIREFIQTQLLLNQTKLAIFQMDQLQQFIDATIDFEGQKFTEKLQKEILIIGAILSFVIGFLSQQIELTVYGVIASLVATLLLVIFPLPKYKKNPLTWQLPSH